MCPSTTHFTLFFSQEITFLKNKQPVLEKSKLKALNPYLDDDLIRVGGWLSNSELPENVKHPIV